MLEGVLEGCGYQLVQARSGRDALRVVLKQEIDLILMDVQMPEMDGFETAQLIHGKKQMQDVPIIFITAHTGPKPLDKFMAAGAVGSLEKPIDPDVLKRKLSLFLSIYKQRQKKQAA